jgi:hypothetical protein
MSDFKVGIKLEFSGMGVDEKADMYINYFPDNSEAAGVDQRIIDWFRERWEEAYGKYRGDQEKDRDDEERREFERLKAKYEP